MGLLVGGEGPQRTKWTGEDKSKSQGLEQGEAVCEGMKSMH